jgi:hypothetical protein
MSVKQGTPLDRPFAPWLLIRCIVGYPPFSIGFDTIWIRITTTRNGMIENSLLAVSVIYVEVYVNPTAEGKNTLQKRVQFINISQIVGHTGFRQDSLFPHFFLVCTRATAKCWFLHKMVIVTLSRSEENLSRSSKRILSAVIL